MLPSVKYNETIPNALILNISAAAGGYKIPFTPVNVLNFLLCLCDLCPCNCQGVQLTFPFLPEIQKWRLPRGSSITPVTLQLEIGLPDVLGVVCEMLF